jgi:hypothetical protein
MSLAPGSHGLWAATAPPAPDGAPLAGAHQADVVVVGAGYTGLSAALHLAEGGANVVVLEAQDIGFGGSGRNVGLVNAGMWVLPSALPDALGPVHGERLLRLLGDAPAVVFDLVQRHGMACEAEHRGTLHCAVGAAGLKNITERARQWQALRAPVELLDAAQTAQAVGTSAYTGALLDRHHPAAGLCARAGPRCPGRRSAPAPPQPGGPRRRWPQPLAAAHGARRHGGSAVGRRRHQCLYRAGRGVAWHR